MYEIHKGLLEDRLNEVVCMSMGWYVNNSEDKIRKLTEQGRRLSVSMIFSKPLFK